MMRFFKFFEYAYLAIMAFFLYQAYLEWGLQGSKSVLYLFFAVIAIFMFFFKRNFRKKYQGNKKG